MNFITSFDYAKLRKNCNLNSNLDGLSIGGYCFRLCEKDEVCKDIISEYSVRSKCMAFKKAESNNAQFDSFCFYDPSDKTNWNDYIQLFINDKYTKFGDTNKALYEQIDWTPLSKMRAVVIV